MLSQCSFGKVDFIWLVWLVSQGCCTNIPTSGGEDNSNSLSPSSRGWKAASRVLAGPALFQRRILSSLFQVFFTVLGVLACWAIAPVSASVPSFIAFVHINFPLCASVSESSSCKDTTHAGFGAHPHPV